VGALISIDNPWLSTNYEYHTLVEQAVSTVNQQQVVEVGWTEDPTTFGDSKPRLFVSAWVNGVWQGYNGNFTNYASRTYTVGDDLTSFIDTGTKQFGVEYFSGAWWVSFNSTWLGYFNGTLWSAAVPTATFVTAPRVQYYGEVVGRSSPCTDMGSNPAVLATATSAGAAKVSSVTYNNVATGVSMAPVATNSAWYSAVLLTGSIRSFNLGGGGPC
jgi:hypothetical protein